MPLNSSPFTPSLEPIREILLIGGTLCVYLGVLSITQSFDLLKMLLTNGIFLGASLLFWKKAYRNTAGFRDGWSGFWVSGTALCGVMFLYLNAYLVMSIIGHPLRPFVSSLLLVTLVPLAEEFFFRGWVLDHLRRNLGPRVAILISAGLFTLMHLGTGGSLLLMAGLGLLTGLLAIMTRSIVYAVIVHMIWNVLAELYVIPLNITAVQITVGLLVVVCLVFCRPKAPQAPSVAPNETLSTTGTP